MKSSKLKYLSIGVSSVVGCALATGAFAQQAQVTQQGRVTTITLPDRAPQAGGGIDYKNAKPLPLPSVRTLPGSAVDSASDVYLGEPGRSPGSQGTGKINPEVLVPQSGLQNLLNKVDLSSDGVDDNGVTPQEYGTLNYPYTTSRVDLLSNPVSRYFPYRPAGKLFFKIGASTYVCSASLIKRGVIVTAAHCVTKYGGSLPRAYTNWQFVPAYYNGSAPYGTWTGKTAYVLSSYYNGADPCTVAGVVCRNDVAVITLNAKTTNPTYPGTSTGWYGYGWNGWGFVGGKTQITQLGYPVSHDSGVLMQRTESQGFVSAANANNTIIGSRQTGGSSGGPWVVNLGYPAVTLNGTGYGSYASWDIVMGTTSWGYVSTSPKAMGASPFLSTNIVPLVNAACVGSPNPGGWCF